MPRPPILPPRATRLAAPTSGTPRRPLLPPTATLRPALVPPPAPASAPVRRPALTAPSNPSNNTPSNPPAVPAPRRRPAPAEAPLPVEQWPACGVYGYSPYDDHRECPLLVRPDWSGYIEVSREIDPIARNRANGVDEATAERVLRAAFAPGGTCRAKTTIY